jgi:putative membrane protein
MKKIIQIYTADWGRIFMNWTAAIIIIELMILPSLYAWFNIESS